MMRLFQREIPSINGSRGGFIALIVCLSALIIGLCAGVYILLRDHEPSDEERAVRRRRHREQTSESSSPFRYISSSANPPTLTQKIGSIFRLSADDNDGRKRSRSGSHKSRAGQGWVQAGSGDDWDSDIDREAEAQTRGVSGSAPQATQRDVEEAHGIRLTDRSTPKDESNLDLPVLPPLKYSRTDSNSSISSLYNSVSYELDTSSSWKSPTSHLAPTRLHISESLAPSTRSPPSSPSPASLSPTPQSAASLGPYASGSTDDVFQADHRHFSTQSGSGSVSVRTFHTGTKFIESLE